MKRRFRLTRSTDFKRVRRFGKSYAHPFVVLVAQRTEESQTRIAVVAGAAIGGAVVRNKVKRRLRACLDEFFPQITPGWDLIVIARKPIVQVGFLQIRTAILDVLHLGGVFEETKQGSCD